MTQFGTETDIAYPDVRTQVETFRNYKDDALKSSFRRHTISHRVETAAEEAAVFADFSLLLQRLRYTEKLLYKHSDPSMLPFVVIKYPKETGYPGWFVVTTYTEVVI